MILDYLDKIEVTITDHVDTGLITLDFINGITLEPVGTFQIAKIHADAFLSSIATIIRTYHSALDVNSKATTKHEGVSGTIDFRDA